MNDRRRFHAVCCLACLFCVIFIVGFYFAFYRFVILEVSSLIDLSWHDLPPYTLFF